jgi:hypothetical protein
VAAARRSGEAAPRSQGPGSPPSVVVLPLGAAVGLCRLPRARRVPWDGEKAACSAPPRTAPTPWPSRDAASTTRHHLRFIVTPEAEMTDLKAFTRDLVTSSARWRAILAPGWGLASPLEHRHPLCIPWYAASQMTVPIRQRAVGRLQNLEGMGLAMAAGQVNG